MMTRLFLVVLFALPAAAQSGPCTAQFVKSVGAKQGSISMTDDAYFFSGALDKPVVGKAAADKAFAPVAAERKNENKAAPVPDRIVAAPSGEMAYEYGTAKASYDERDTGKHVEFTAAYLRVWKAVDGSCKIAAEIFEPEEK
jgi:ketosteroid isomerase-like protein